MKINDEIYFLFNFKLILFKLACTIFIVLQILKLFE